MTIYRSGFALLGLSLLVAVMTVGCDRQLDLGSYEFQCDEPSDCVAPYVCDTNAGVCVLEDAGGVEDATQDAVEDSDDPEDTSDAVAPPDTSDTSHDGDTSDADNDADSTDDSNSTDDTDAATTETSQ